MPDTTITVADEEAAAHPITEPIPTDDAGLYEFVCKTPNYKRWLIAAHIKHQTGNDLTDRVDPIIAQVTHDEDIHAAREQLRHDLAAAETAIAAAWTTYTTLTSDELYDVEYAEGGDLLPHYLRKAGRAIRTAIAVNPIFVDTTR